MLIKGRTWVFGRHVNTDLIFPPAGGGTHFSNNDLPDGSVFHSITLTGIQYVIGGHSISVGARALSRFV